jgi:ankyrin repeat protein
MGRESRTLNRAFLDAVVSCNKDEIRRLLKAGAKVDARDEEHDEAAIILAVKFCDAEIIDLLLAAGAKIDARDDHGRTALFFADVGSDTFARLLAAGAGINTLDHDGNTILMKRVSQSASVTEVEELLRLGINANAKNVDGESARDLAIGLGLINVIECLNVTPTRSRITSEEIPQSS